MLPYSVRQRTWYACTAAPPSERGGSQLTSREVAFKTSKATAAGGPGKLFACAPIRAAQKSQDMQRNLCGDENATVSLPSAASSSGWRSLQRRHSPCRHPPSVRLHHRPAQSRGAPESWSDADSLVTFLCEVCGVVGSVKALPPPPPRRAAAARSRQLLFRDSVSMKEQEREDGEWCVEVQRGSGDQGRISEGEGGTEDATLGGTGEDRKSSHPLTFSTYGTIR